MMRLLRTFLTKQAILLLKRNGYVDMWEERVVNAQRERDNWKDQYERETRAHKHTLETVSSEKTKNSLLNERITELKTEVDNFAVRTLGVGFYDRSVTLESLGLVKEKRVGQRDQRVMPHEAVRQETQQFISQVSQLSAK